MIYASRNIYPITTLNFNVLEIKNECLRQNIGNKFYFFAGLDMAFVKSGYRYHTKYDTFDNIPLGSFQHVGDNALFLVKSLANAPELGTLEEQPYGKPTYFDVFGWFMVSYSDTLAIILNLLGITISFVAFAKCFKDFELGMSLF